MVTVRTAKKKGNAFEYDVQYSLKSVFNDITLTKERGFQKEYDMYTDEGRAVIECKRLAGISWNKAKKFLDKLEALFPKGYKSYLIFKSNRQPCLVMTRDLAGEVTIKTFDNYFGVRFVKHLSTRTK